MIFIKLHHYILFFICNTWEQRKLGEVLKERTERAKGDEELLSVTIANGVIRQIDSEKRNTASEDRSNYKIVKKGDVPYNSMRMWQGAVGNSKYNGIVSPAYTILTPTPEANGKFFMELFKKKSTLQIFQRWSQGLTSDTWNLKYPILSSIQFAIPSVEEQEKIAEYFSSLDHLITLHQRKYSIIYNKLITWEQRKLGELAEIVGGGTPSTSVNSYWDGDIDWYAPAEIGEQIYLESSQLKITEEGLNKSSAKILPIGTVLFTSRAGIGKTAILQKEGCTNQGFQSIVPNKEKLDSYFIFTRSEELKRYGETVGAGSTFVEVSGKQMANMELMMPKTMPEQQQIGEFFANLDHLITLHRRAL